MAVVFVADSETTNGTAGTSVVISRPTGTIDGHGLVAFVAAVGNPTITPPAGWVLIATQDASTSVRLAVYRKVASAEPASWTWTLGASQRNWGWVGTHSGVDTANPVFATLGGTGSGTTYHSIDTDDFISVHRQGGLMAAAVAGVRAASGSATTWTASIFATEIADLSTNAGAGTDIAGAVSNRTVAGARDVASTVLFTASLAQTAMASLAVALRPAFTRYDGGLYKPIVEAAFGADPATDPSTWTWTDISADVQGRVSIKTGRDARGAIDQESTPTTIGFTLLDTTGKYMPDNPNGAHYPNIVEDVPVRVRVPFGYTPPTSLATAFVDEWAPTWDDNGKLAFVTVSASGRLQRLRDTSQPAHSMMRRFFTGGITPIYPHAYYPLEDESGASRIASALPGHQPLSTTGGVSFGGASDLPASKPLPTLPDNGVIAGALGPGYAATGQWCVLFVAKLPETPVAVESRLALVTCTGTAREWALWLVPGSPQTLNLRASIFGASLLDDPVSIVEADHYGKWRMYSVGVIQNGADVDYQFWSLDASVGVGSTGTVAGRTIGVARTARFVAFSALAGLGLGHLSLFADPTFDVTFDPLFMASVALDGNAGETPWTRFARLAAEESILAETLAAPTGSSPIYMGPQPPAQAGQLLQEPGDTDHGLIHDGTPSGAVAFVARARLYNQDPQLVLDNALYQVPVGLRPITDGQSRITDSTVTRDGGSSARYVNPHARGSKPDSKTLSVQNDQHLFEIAGWRVTLGSQPGLRYAEVPIDLYTRPELTESWMRTSIGSRAKAIHLPATHGPNEADGILVGWRQEVDADRWMVYMNLAPARPYDVPVMESGDEKTWRLETGGSEMAAAASSSTTSLTVLTNGMALWTTDAGNMPFDADVNGERVTVTAITSSVRDTFTRTVSDGWSTSDSGHTWTNSGGAAADYDVTSSKGFQTHPSANVIHHSSVSIGTSDHRVRAYINLGSGTLGGAGATGFVLARMTDTSNWYAARVGYATSGVVTLQIAKMVGGAGALVGSGSWSLGTHANYAAVQFIVQLDVQGSTLSASAWDATTTEPTTWQVIETDTDLTTGTLGGLASRRDTGNTDANLICAWDNFAVLNPQTLTVTRGVAGGATAKAHSAGAPVKLWRARGLAL